MSAPVIDAKLWASIRSKAALAGFTVLRSNPEDGPVVFYVERHGLARQVRPAEIEILFASGGGSQQGAGL